ncbi:MAG: methionine biosynthesis protein MetW, partial [Phycisphaeraceae bacterium]|nr:methionine biosynthesis protein MetW [Phycisphaeraceae bacterium]
LILSFTSDWLFPASQSREMTDALICQGKYVSFCNITSDAGHDAFLLKNDLQRYGGMVQAFLNTTTIQGTFIPAQPLPEDQPAEPRYDLEQLIGLVDEGKSVLDLGSSRGSLMTRLAHERHAQHLVGVDLDEYKLQQAMQRGFDVVQADLEEGLPDFQDKQFDYVVLSLTLQTIVHTEAIVDEMLRVGKRCIVSYPNFAYHKIRKMLHEEGRSPGAEGGMLHHNWYDTPNRRFLSILDWQIFCTQRDITIHRHLFLNMEQNQNVSNDPNTNADMAICVFSR